MEENIICRLCLEVVPVGYTIFEENIQSLIKTLTSIDVSMDKHLPKLSCSKCIFNLYFIDSIRKLIVKSDEKLRTVINRDGNFDELLRNKSAIILVEGDTHNNADSRTSVNVEIKEEKFTPIPAEEIPEVVSPEQFDDPPIYLNEDVQEETGPEEPFDENDIRNIIFKKNDSKPYQYHCVLCNEDFQGNKMYMKHKGKHMKKTCEICGVTTRCDNFNKHMTIHKLGKQICDMCGSIHKSLEGLRTHLFHFHNAKKKMYTCGECGESFKYSHRLSGHKRKIHTGFRPHQCDTCGKRFFDLGTMKKHVKLIHLKLREYHCKFCKKDYSSRYALKVHIRQHTDETPYVCEICTEGFRQLVSLKTHMAKHERATNTKDEEKEEEGLVMPQ